MLFLWYNYLHCLSTKNLSKHNFLLYVSLNIWYYIFCIIVYKGEYMESEIKNDIIEGRNAVIEALRAEKPIDKIYIAKGSIPKHAAFMCVITRRNAS